MQPWPRQRLDSVGATPTGAIETVALRTAGVLARSNSTTNRIINLEQILDGKRTYLLALAAPATRLSTANDIVPMPTPAPANPPSATRILHSRARRAAAGEDARAPSPKASGERENVRLCSLMFAYVRLIGEKMFEGRGGVIKPVDRAKSTSGTIAVRPTSTASQNFERNDH